jgi:hypothetical protein
MAFFSSPRASVTPAGLLTNPNHPQRSVCAHLLQMRNRCSGEATRAIGSERLRGTRVQYGRPCLTHLRSSPRPRPPTSQCTPIDVCLHRPDRGSCATQLKVVRRCTPRVPMQESLECVDREGHAHLQAQAHREIRPFLAGALLQGQSCRQAPLVPLPCRAMPSAFRTRRRSSRAAKTRASGCTTWPRQKPSLRRST